MSGDSYNGKRKINRSNSKKRRSKSRSGRKYKGDDMINSEFMNNLNINQQQQTIQHSNGSQIQNPFNLDYDPMHVQYLVPFNGEQMNQVQNYNLGFEQMTQGPQMNGLSSMFPQQNQPQMMNEQMMMGQQQQMMGQQQMMPQQFNPVGQQFMQ